jgi:selenocysteine-specific elongation factor
MATDVFAALHAEGQLEPVISETAPTINRGATGGFIRLRGFVPTFTAAQQQLVERLLRQFNQSPYTPPVYAEAENIVGPEVLASLIEQGRLVKLGDGILFLRETHDEAIARLVAYLRQHGKMTAAEARDVLGTTRKYVLPLLEHMDEQHITRRKGDERVLAMEHPGRAQGVP